MGDVTVLGGRKRTKADKPGEFKVSVGISFMSYANNGDDAGDRVLAQLLQRIEGMQPVECTYHVEPMPIEHHKA